MRKRFTKFLAALALLLFMTPSLAGWGQAPVNTTLWGETWTGGTAGETPSDYGFEGTTVYGGATLTYAQSSVNTKLYDEQSAGGTTPELLLSMSDQTWTISNIPTGQATEMSLTFLSNRTTFAVTSTTNGITISGSQKSWTITATSSVENFNLTIKNTGSKNARIDNILLKVTTAGGDPTPAYTITTQSNDNDYGTVSLTGTTITATPKSGYRVIAGNGGYTVITGTATVTNNGDNTFSVAPESDCTVQINFEAIPTHTITFHAGSGTCTTASITEPEGETITLPTATPSQACASRGWTFAGWATESISETPTAPTLLNGSYNVDDDADLYAVYKVTEGNGGTETFNFETIASNNNWNNATVYNPVTQGAVTLTGYKGTSSNDCPIYYSSDDSWRMYNGSSLTVSSSGSDVTAVTSSPIQSFTINSNGTATISFSTTVKFTEISVTYGTTTTTYNTNPDCLEQVATPTFTPAAGTYTGSQNVTIECDTDEATIHYKTAEEGEWMTYNAAIPVSTTTTIWAKATKNGMDDSEVAEATYTIQYILTAAMTNVAEFTVSVGGDPIALTNNQAPITAGATVSVNLTIEDCYVLNSLTVNSSTEGVTEESGVYSFVMPEGNATVGVSTTQKTEYTLTVVGGENVTFDMSAGSGDTPISLINNTVSICEQLPVRIANLTAISGRFIESVALTEGGASTTLTPEGGVYSFTMPSENATLTFTTGSAPTYTLANSIISGKSYIIVGFNGNDAYAMGEQKTSNRAGVGITVNGTTATGNAAVHEVVITALEGDDAGKYTIAVNDGYLYASSSGSNQLKTKSELDDNGKWTIVIANNGDATITAQGSNSRKLMRFNPNNGSPLFACYATDASTGSLPRLYVKEETYELTINHYNPEATTANGWYLIASPVYTTPSQVGNLIGEQISTNPVSYNYDLYRFNQATTSAEWENYHQHTGDFNIVPGQGYLYAKSTDATLTFTGAPYNGNGVISLNYSEANSNSNMWGWNLIGNPFAVTANLPGGFSYYTLNGNRDDLIPSSANTINAMEAIFVKATAEDQSVTFTKQSRNAEGNANAVMALNLSSNSNGLIDRTIVRFDEGSTLPKFMFNESHTKIYIPQNGEDYAVVCGETQGEMPINFKAMEDGQYTISMEPEGVEVSYLHLIDNIAGTDIDLLATPSYTFNAKGDDYESRFRLVFSANMTNAELSDDFAFISNGELIINGTGTLQVIDALGRIVVSKNLSTLTSHLSPLTFKAGVYVLRLVNGTDVKTQKIVIR